MNKANLKPQRKFEDRPLALDEEKQKFNVIKNNLALQEQNQLSANQNKRCHTVRFCGTINLAAATTTVLLRGAGRWLSAKI